MTFSPTYKQRKGKFAKPYGFMSPCKKWLKPTYGQYMEWHVHSPPNDLLTFYYPISIGKNTPRLDDNSDSL